MYEYSKKEIALIEYYFPDLIKDKYFCNIAAPVIYRMMVEEAFIKDENNIFSHSLRECYKAFRNCKIYRLTPEWEALIHDNVLGTECHYHYNFNFIKSINELPYISELEY